MSKLLDLLKRHEGVRKFPYLCSADKLTIGVGRNLDDVGLSDDEINILLVNDVARCHSEAEQYPFFNKLDPVRQAVVLSMLFNLGNPRFSGFVKFAAALEAGDFELASQEMLSSRWADQVKGRATELAQMMRTGEWI